MKQVESDIHIQRPVKDVIHAFLNENELKNWWGVARSYIEPKVEGCYCLTWEIGDDGFKYVSTGIIKTLSQNKLIIDHLLYLNPERSILGGMKVEYTFNAIKDGTHLHVIQSGYKTGVDWDWYYQAVVEGWPMTLQNLKKYMES